jgi:anti-anti-sigma factor
MWPHPKERTQVMEISVRREERFAIVEVRGKIVRDNHVQLRETLLELIETEPAGIALGFEGVDYLDSAALGSCASILKIMHDKRCGALVMFGASPNIEKVWRLVRLDMVIPLFSSEADALARLRTEKTS